MDAAGGISASKPYVEYSFLRKNMYIRVYVPSVPLSRLALLKSILNFNTMKNLDKNSLETLQGGGSCLGILAILSTGTAAQQQQAKIIVSMMLAGYSFSC